MQAITTTRDRQIAIEIGYDTHSEFTSNFQQIILDLYAEANENGNDEIAANQLDNYYKWVCANAGRLNQYHKFLVLHVRAILKCQICSKRDLRPQLDRRNALATQVRFLRHFIVNPKN